MIHRIFRVKSGPLFRFTGCLQNRSSQFPFFNLQGLYSVKLGPLFGFTRFLQSKPRPPLLIYRVFTESSKAPYSIITGFAISVPFSCRKIIEEIASDLLERKKSCTRMMFAMYLLHAGGLLEHCMGNKPFVITVSTSNLFVLFYACHSEYFYRNRLHGRRAIHCNTGAMFAHVLKRR